MNNIKNLKFIGNKSFFLIAGPCIIESREETLKIANTLKSITDKLEIPFIFKGSFKKANRTRLNSFTGIGDEIALNILKDVKEKLKIPIITDVHSIDDIKKVKDIVDVIQIPAFLCRQTDLLTYAAETKKCINIKKGQFLSPESMNYAIDKITSNNNNNVLVTERGSMFGYNDLVVDFRSITIMKEFGFPVILDITHSLQQPNMPSGVTGGKPKFIETIAKAGIAVDVDGIFLETHIDPKNSKSDGENMLKLDLVENLLQKLKRIKDSI
tara:strand:- start:1139 stop:1945 length:807 start_codon:yes stop_codon:yes gene_type:complete